MGDNGSELPTIGRVGRVQAAARIGGALIQGPLTMYAACLKAHKLSECQWKRLSVKNQQRIRSQIQGILDCIESVGGKLLAEDKQGNTTIYFLAEY